jgi:hypothetical protein
MVQPRLDETLKDEIERLHEDIIRKVEGLMEGPESLCHAEREHITQFWRRQTRSRRSGGTAEWKNRNTANMLVWGLTSKSRTCTLMVNLDAIPRKLSNVQADASTEDADDKCKELCLSAAGKRL